MPRLRRKILTPPTRNDSSVKEFTLKDVEVMLSDGTIVDGEFVAATIEARENKMNEQKIAKDSPDGDSSAENSALDNNADDSRVANLKRHPTVMLKYLFGDDQPPAPAPTPCSSPAEQATIVRNDDSALYAAVYGKFLLDAPLASTQEQPPLLQHPTPQTPSAAHDQLAKEQVGPRSKPTEQRRGRETDRLRRIQIERKREENRMRLAEADRTLAEIGKHAELQMQREAEEEVKKEALKAEESRSPPKTSKAKTVSPPKTVPTGKVDSPPKSGSPPKTGGLASKTGTLARKRGVNGKNLPTAAITERDREEAEWMTDSPLIRNYSRFAEDCFYGMADVATTPILPAYPMPTHDTSELDCACFDFAGHPARYAAEEESLLGADVHADLTSITSRELFAEAREAKYVDKGLEFLERIDHEAGKVVTGPMESIVWLSDDGQRVGGLLREAFEKGKAAEDQVKQRAAEEALAQLELAGQDILDYSCDDPYFNTLTFSTAVPSPARRCQRTPNLCIDTAIELTPDDEDDDDKDSYISPLQLDNNWSPIQPDSSSDSNW